MILRDIIQGRTMAITTNKPFYKRWPRQLLEKIKEVVFRGKKTKKTTPSRSASVKSHQRVTNIHGRNKPRQIQKHHVVTPVMPRPHQQSHPVSTVPVAEKRPLDTSSSPSQRTKPQRTKKVAPDYSKKAEQMFLKTLAGKTHMIREVPEHAPAAGLRTKMALEHGIPLSRMGRIIIRGREVFDHQPLWRCLDPREASVIHVVYGNSAKNDAALEADMMQLFGPNGDSTLMVEKGDAVSHLDSWVLDACQRVMDGKLSVEDAEFVELHDDLNHMMGVAQKTTLANKDVSMRYLSLLTGMLTAFENATDENMKKPEKKPPAPVRSEPVTNPVTSGTSKFKPIPTAPSSNLGFKPVQRVSEEDRGPYPVYLNLKDLAGGSYSTEDVMSNTTVAEVKMKLAQSGRVPLSDVTTMIGYGQPAKESATMKEAAETGSGRGAPSVMHLVRPSINKNNLDADLRALLPGVRTGGKAIHIELADRTQRLCEPVMNGLPPTSPKAFNALLDGLRDALNVLNRTPGLKEKKGTSKYLEQLVGVMSVMQKKVPAEVNVAPVKVMSREDQLRLDQNLMAECLVPWEKINWPQVTNLVKAGADPAVHLGNKITPTPMFMVTGQYCSDARLRTQGDPNRKERLECLQAMLKHPRAVAALNEVDDGVFGNTPLTWAVAQGDEDVANLMLDRIEAQPGLESLITQPNKKTMADQFGNNTPLMLAMKTDKKKLAARLLPHYSYQDLVVHKTGQGYDACELASYGRFNELLPHIWKQAPPGKRAELKVLYMEQKRQGGLDIDLYETDMYFGKRVGGGQNTGRRPDIDPTLTRL